MAAVEAKTAPDPDTWHPWEGKTYATTERCVLFLSAFAEMRSQGKDEDFVARYLAEHKGSYMCPVCGGSSTGHLHNSWSRHNDRLPFKPSG